MSQVGGGSEEEETEEAVHRRHSPRHQTAKPTKARSQVLLARPQKVTKPPRPIEELIPSIIVITSNVGVADFAGLL